MTGVIKRKMPKGFGFITPDDQSKDLFFLSSSLVGVTFDDLEEGAKVSFDPQESPKGMNAVNVQLV